MEPAAAATPIIETRRPQFGLWKNVELQPTRHQAGDESLSRCLLTHSENVKHNKNTPEICHKITHAAVSGCESAHGRTSSEVPTVHSAPLSEEPNHCFGRTQRDLDTADHSLTPQTQEVPPFSPRGPPMGSGERTTKAWRPHLTCLDCNQVQLGREIVHIPRCESEDASTFNPMI